MNSNATVSSVDVSQDPYSVPPLPSQNNMPYRDDPSRLNSYYDPYRGPVPQTFATPPASTDGHVQQWGGEAIPMNAYPRTTSPGPNLAYNDPYAGSMGPSRSTSPGPNLAYGLEGGRGGTPVQRMVTPNIGGQELPRSGTPGYYTGSQPYDPYGRRSPGPNLAYGQ